MRSIHILRKAPRGTSVHTTEPACGTEQSWPALAWTHFSDEAAWRRTHQTLQALESEGQSQLCQECLRVRTANNAEKLDGAA